MKAGLNILALFVGFVSASGTLLAQSGGVLTADKSLAVVSTPTTLAFTLQLPADPKLIVTSPNLQRLGGTGWSVVSRLYDDGTHGDAVAGDNTFSVQVVLNEPQMGAVSFRASSAYQKILRRVYSNVLAVDIVDEPVVLAISLDPELAQTTTTSDPVLPIAGTVILLSGHTYPAEVQWRNATGLGTSDGSFSVDSSGTFVGAINLQPGDNHISFGAGGQDNLATLVVTYYPGYEFGGNLAVTPDVLYVDEPRLFTAKIALTDFSTDPNGVRLVQEVGGQEIVIGQLTDDGNLGNGDEIQADRIFSGLFNLVASQPQTISLRVVVHTLGGAYVRSEPFQLLSTSHLSAPELQTILSLQQEKTVLLQNAAAAGNLLPTLTGMLAEVQQMPFVAQAGIGEGSNGLWLVYTSGVAGVIYSPTSGVKGGPPSSPRPTDPPLLAPLYGADTPYEAYRDRVDTAAAPALKATSFGLASASATANEIDSSKALVIAAQYWDWGENDDIPEIEQLLQQHCLEVSYLRYTSSGSGNVNDFKNLGDYGIICISSHGDTYYKGILSLWQERFGWNGFFGQVIVHSNMEVTEGNKAQYEDDLKKGRLVIWYGSYGMTPTFFAHYVGNMPNSLVYMSICRGTYNSTLANAFLQRGAGSFLGYSDYVAVPFCKNVGVPFFESFLEPDATVDDAFVPNQRETDSDPAEFRLFGSSSLTLGDVGTQLHDGDFESGNISQAWSVSGDGRIIPYLGSFAPVDGNRMGVISTGLGFTTQSGSIEQTICIPSDATAISFWWNFVSEEFLEWCGSIYQDRFLVGITDEANQSDSTQLFETHVDALCGQVSPVGFSFDQGDCYATGWRYSSVPIPEAYRGKKVILKFYCTDVGDSIYDTAVLLDAISIETP